MVDFDSYTVGGLSRPELSAMLGVDLENWQWKLLVQLVGEKRREEPKEVPF